MSFQLPFFNFKPGRPIEGESLEDAFKEPRVIQLNSLEGALLGLKKMKIGRVSIEGNADGIECSGQDCYVLSYRRAKMVRDWLISHGAPPERLGETRGWGAERILNENDTEEARSYNRRVELNLAN